MKFDLLLKKEFDEKKMIEMDRLNQEWDVYYVALACIKNRLRSVFELEELLARKEYPKELIDSTIQRLMNQGYLNDQIYAKSYIHTQMLTTNKGPYKIEKELLDKRIDRNIIQEELKDFSDEEQISKITKLIDRGIKSNHTKGGVVLKQKIYNELKIQGYDISLLNQVFSSFSFDENQDIARKEYEKLLRKYSRKYEGDALKKIVQQKMYLKGFHYEEE